MAKEARGAVVSVRLSDDEQNRLKKIAEERGTSVSELIRSYVADETAPVVQGQTVPSTPPTAGVIVERPGPAIGGTEVSAGFIRWTTAGGVSEAAGAALTLRANDPEAS